jgi:hypothetical protein
MVRLSGCYWRAAAVQDYCQGRLRTSSRDDRRTTQCAGREDKASDRSALSGYRLRSRCAGRQVEAWLLCNERMATRGCTAVEGCRGYGRTNTKVIKRSALEQSCDAGRIVGTLTLC